MKRNYYDGCRGELASINEKCDTIIILLESVLDNPDFLIDRLRRSVELQHRSSIRPKMKVVRYGKTR